VNESENSGSGSGLTVAQEYLRRLWEEHVRHEFDTHSTEDTLATMVEDAYVNHIPVMTGGVGQDELREFYSKRFIPQMPPDTEMTPISRTIGNNQLVDEMVSSSLTASAWTGCSRALLQRESEWRCRWSPLSNSGRANWRTSTFIGTKLPCSFNSGCSRPVPYLSRVLKARVRPLIRVCLRTS